MEKDFIVAVHKTYRLVVAICDSDVQGKTLEEGERQLDVSTKFFEGDSVGGDELISMIEKYAAEDATFYIVGEKSVALASEVGLIDSDSVLTIDGVSFALVLL